MIKEFCEAWEKNNGRLREYISSHDQGEYSSYKELVCKLFEHCINPYMKNLIKNSCGDETFSIDKITEIDNGDYQGTLLFIIPRNIDQPDVSNYVFTSVYYGSCSYCDTLQGIHQYSYGLPSEDQVNDYMYLLLHLLENCHWLIDKEKI